MTEPLDELTKVVEQLDPLTLTGKDLDELKLWGADNVGMVFVDLDTQKVVFATSGAEKIFGYMQDEMSGMDLIELVPDSFRSAHPQHVEGFNSHPFPRSMGKRDATLYGKERDGKTFPVEIGLFPRKFKSRRICLANVVRLSKEV